MTKKAAIFIAKANDLPPEFRESADEFLNKFTELGETSEDGPNLNPEPERGAGKGAGWEDTLLHTQIMAYRDLTSMIGHYMDVLQHMINAGVDWAYVKQVFEIITKLAAAREQLWELDCLSKEDDDKFQEAVERFVNPYSSDEEPMW
ncbi:hypothetical protein [Bifidobacterium vansinderenii]|uniref:Uncharacterized protein n=1 Tax=Bifidobacterium vansinderenii TaxID=1984871 RepID=A0A229VWB3_9BIFI|nr:hypothetical protein [Bifidobacterium vansinderenii]OXM99913.1 hypothetical protein Tam10B_1876 [Bifidobacterium vansinderenii]